MTNFTGLVLLRETVDHLKEAIDSLERHTDAVNHADWIVVLNQLVVEIEEKRKH